MKNSLLSFIKSEIVLLLSFLLAIVSMFFVTPGIDYLDYIDFNTLSLLFCLMAVMAGANRLGLFDRLAKRLLARVRTLRALGFALCSMCFFSSMLITNDVALITFIPFTIIVLRLSGQLSALIPLATFETIAANLGSMLTPIGNPQNLYLFTFYQMEPAEFFLTLLPYGLLSFLLIGAFLLLFEHKVVNVILTQKETPAPDGWRCAFYAVLFLLALLTVFRVFPSFLTLLITVIALLCYDRQTFRRVDYSLLLTFLFLFVFIGNLGKIPIIHDTLQYLVGGRETLAGVLASQIFSNVPAAVLLSNFTQDAAALLVGVNLGGLGTLIASMASLISFKFVTKEVPAGKYLFFFTWVNVVFLLLLLLLWMIL